MDGNRLRVRAREALLAGRLPTRRPDRLWGGPGEGTRCALCELPIEREEIGYELEFAENGHAAASHHLHLQCHSAWDSEARQAACPPDDADDAQAAGRLPDGAGERRP
jgi:hypothetical protein